MLRWQSTLEGHLRVVHPALEELVDVESRFMKIGFCFREK